MPGIPLDTRKALTDQRTPSGPISLITIYPVDGSAPIRICDHPTQRISTGPIQYGTVSRGETYKRYVMSVSRPDSSRERLPAASITFDNVDYSFVEAARSSIEESRVTMEVVNSRDPDTPIKRYPDMKISEATIDAMNVTLTASYDSVVGEPLHKHRLTRNVAPGLRPTS